MFYSHCIGRSLSTDDDNVFDVDFWMAPIFVLLPIHFAQIDVRAAAAATHFGSWISF